MQIQELESRSEEAATFLKMLASPPRLMILCHLAAGERSVGEIAELTGLRMSTVSQHMALLRGQDLVTTRRDGTTIYYALASDAARDVMGVLYQAFCVIPGPSRKTD
ncbi:MAG TPA: metalloregulator ArsR/SmtB family transcription factor [Candidatus Ozemobacteraceae bacterium]|nr:metalloregulator ArsR/SmtB family transcription factor [Candidatus Ozemobacteraceae bacterium]